MRKSFGFVLNMNTYPVFAIVVDDWDMLIRNVIFGSQIGRFFRLRGSHIGHGCVRMEVLGHDSGSNH